MNVEHKINKIFALVGDLHGDEVKADLEKTPIRIACNADGCGNDGYDYKFVRIRDLKEDEADFLLESLQIQKIAHTNKSPSV